MDFAITVTLTVALIIVLTGIGLIGQYIQKKLQQVFYRKLAENMLDEARKLNK